MSLCFMESFMINISIAETFTLNTLICASMRANLAIMTIPMIDFKFVYNKFTFISLVQRKEIRIRKLAEIIFPYSFLNLIINLAYPFFFANIFTQVIILTDMIIHKYVFTFMIVLKCLLIS